MAGRSLALLLLLGLPASAHASSTDAQRFGRFATGAHATGTITLTIRYSGQKSSGCDAAGTCGVSGRVTAKLKLDPKKKIAAPRGGVVVLPGSGTITATVASPKCHDTQRMTSAGIAFAGDGQGLLLHPGAVSETSKGQDPFATRCAGPGLLDIGNDTALPSVRLKAVPSDVSEVTLTFHDSRDLDRAGYAGTVSVNGKIHLRHP